MQNQETITKIMEKLLAQIPIDGVMNKLTGSHPTNVELITQTILIPNVAIRPDLTAGLWLYVDDLESSHGICQDLETPTGSLWHGILHRREGDYSNSRYWMRRANSHPLISSGVMDPNKLITAVEQSSKKDDLKLVEAQKEEWKIVFNWCLEQSGS